MVLGDVSRTRRLAGNPSTSNVSDADITQGLTFGTSRAIGLTGKANWESDTLHTDYPTIVMAVEYYASSMIRDRFQDQSDISSEHYKRANELLQAVADSLASTSGSGGGGSGIASRLYRSYPLNSSATIYRSMLSQGQTLIGVGDYIPVQY